MELVTTKICMTLDIGVNNSLFGGNMMSLLDEAAAAYACQICALIAAGFGGLLGDAALSNVRKVEK